MTNRRRRFYEIINAEENELLMATEHMTLAELLRELACELRDEDTIVSRANAKLILKAVRQLQLLDKLAAERGVMLDGPRTRRHKTKGAGITRPLDTTS